MQNPLPLAALALLAACSSAPTPAPPLANEVLIFTKTAGYRHASIPDGIACLEELAREAGLVPRATEDATTFNPTALRSVAAVVFLSTTGDILDETQQAAFEAYMQAGGGFLGIHAAADTEYDWPYYASLVGAQFDSHPKIQPARLTIVDATSPATAFLPTPWERSDEWYNYKNIEDSIHVLVELDESSYEGGTNGPHHPAAWTHRLGPARAFYTAGGHTKESYQEPLFRQHLAAALRFAADRPLIHSGTPESH